MILVRSFELRAYLVGRPERVLRPFIRTEAESMEINRTFGYLSVHSNRPRTSPIFPIDSSPTKLARSLGLFSEQVLAVIP